MNHNRNCDTLFEIDYRNEEKEEEGERKKKYSMNDNIYCVNRIGVI